MASHNYAGYKYAEICMQLSYSHDQAALSRRIVAAIIVMWNSTFMTPNGQR